MPTYRKLHTKILDSYDFAEMPNDFTRVFWMLLIVVVDSEGRAIDNPAWLRSRMFPMRSDVPSEQIESALAWLAEREMIVRYQVGGRRYFYVINFKVYQSGTEREAKSVLPSPELLTTSSRVSQEEVDDLCTVSASVNESESVIVLDSLYSVYEKEIGPLTPTISEELKLAETEYPAGYVVDALREASKNNKRSWAYAHAILRRWKTEGKGSNNGKQPAPATGWDAILQQEREKIKRGEA